MAGDWIKIRVCLPDEPEVIAIAQAVGIDEDSVVGKLVRIWRWADQHTTDGNARGVTKSWIDRHVGAQGFASAMEANGWLECSPEGIQFPEFEKHNTETGKARALAAKRSAKFRGNSNANSNGVGVTKCAPTEDTDRDLDTEEELEEDKPKKNTGLAKAKPSSGKPDRSNDVRQVFEHYRQHHPKAHPKPRSKMREWKLILARFDEGYSVADLCAAIDGCHRTPWNTGENPGSKQFTDLELIVRNSDKVSRFMEAPIRAGPVLSEKTQRTLRAAESWASKGEDHGDDDSAQERPG